MAAEPEEFSFNLNDWDAYENGLGAAKPPSIPPSREPSDSSSNAPSGFPIELPQEPSPAESHPPEEPPPELPTSFQDLLRLVGHVDLEKLKDTLSTLGIVISDDFLKEIMEMNPKEMEGALVSFGVVNEEELLDILAKQAGLDRVHLSEIDVTASLLREIPGDLVHRLHVFPVRADDDTLWFAMADPLDIRVVDELRKHLRKNPIPLVAGKEEIEKFIRHFYPEAEAG